MNLPLAHALVIVVTLWVTQGIDQAGRNQLARLAHASFYSVDLDAVCMQLAHDSHPVRE